jgi:hypothetical protein
MAWPWWSHWQNPKLDEQGNLQFLLGREADPALCRPADVGASAAELALKAICDAFRVPLRQRNCLRPDDELKSIYAIPPEWPDCMEYETLHLLLQRIVGPLTSSEFCALRTVGDVMRLIEESDLNT